MKERVEAVKEYLKYFPNDLYGRNNLLLCEYADELNLELNGSYYPKIEYKYCVINRQIKAGKTFSLTNSATKYKCNGEDIIVIWDEPSGRLAFVNGDYWWDIADEWEEFMNTLMSYNPLDWDKTNDKYIFDLENGKRLINDYDGIVKDFMDKANKKIKEVEIRKKKQELERLQKELEEVE